MTGKTTSAGLVMAILKKDIRVYSRNMIYLFLTVLSLAFFVAIFWLVPDTVDEEITLAIFPPLSVMLSEGRESLIDRGVPPELLEEFDEIEAAFGEEGFELVEFESEEDLVKALRSELEVYRTEPGRFVTRAPGSDSPIPEGASEINLDIGMAFSPSFLSDAVLGQQSAVTVYVDAAAPEEIRGAMQSLIREIAFQLAGHELPVEIPAEETIVLGQDRLGDQISMRDRMRPLIAFFIMMMETFALASLISNEVLQRTVTALTVTPMRTWHFLLAKTIFGTALAMGQAVIILALVGAFTAANWPLLLLIVLLGSVLFTAVAMLVGSAGKDFIGQLMFSMLFLIPMMIPSFAVLFPGSVAAWVRVLPSYPVVRLLYDVTVHDYLWADSVVSLGHAALWAIVIYCVGLFVLKRKVAAL